MEIATNQLQAAEMMYHIALDCAEHKARKNCNLLCQSCKSNIELYGTPTREAMLLNRNAELEVQQRFNLSAAIAKEREAYRKSVEAQEHEYTMGCAMFGLIFLGIIVFCVWFFNTRLRPPEQTYVPDNYIEYIPMIVETLERIYDVDMNHDGKINCIDMAIQFYNAYPNRSDVRIILNRHPTNGFNHLFVYVAGVCIEPASVLRPIHKPKPGEDPVYDIGVSNYWGSKYDPRYDRDVTAHWAEIRVNKYGW
jgi:hypothetical protein